MKILMINKFLHPNGGSETYIFKLGEYLTSAGNEVQYFGMDHAGRCVGNAVDAYTSDMDFHGHNPLVQLSYALKTIYSKEARTQIRKVLDDFKPDVCHINNFNYQLTPSIILEINKWMREGNACRIVYTAHDYQLVCPNHMCNNPNSHENCEKCIYGAFSNCISGRCVHGSLLKSVIGAAEAMFWKKKGVYESFDAIICCSEFLKSKMDANPVFAKKTVAIHNFVEKCKNIEVEKKDYILYFGRYSVEKGIGSLIQVCRELPNIQFVFAGTGDLEDEINAVDNIRNVGFKSKDELEKLIREARFSVYPSEWYENCPFSVMESQMYGTPVLGAAIGGIPELVTDGVTGKTFTSGDVEDLKQKIIMLWENRELLEKLSANCKNVAYDDIEEYCRKLMLIYREGI